MNPFTSIQNFVKLFSTQSTEFDAILNTVPGRRVLLVDENYTWLRESKFLPTLGELKSAEFNFLQNRQTAVLIGDFIFLTTDVSHLSGFTKVNLRTALDGADQALQSQLVLGTQLIRWSESTFFCASCSVTLKIHDVEIAKICEGCKRVFYPHIHPVAIVLITRNSGKQTELLLARGLPPREHYSCIAGFVEAGESLENCVHREVLEEVGVTIKNLKYFGSQTWPFPSQLMMGFTAEWESGDIRVDKNEISDAQWFHIQKLPSIPPRLSIARKMIDSKIC